MRAAPWSRNTSPTPPYRSAGRPEVMFVMERLIDLAARRHGFDRLDLRRRNLFPPSAMPYRNPSAWSTTAATIAPRRIARSSSPTGRGSRRAAPRRAGAGAIAASGIANYIELNTGAPRERAHITVQPEGRIDVILGTLSSGQGHETSFAQLLASGSAWSSPTCA